MHVANRKAHFNRGAVFERVFRSRDQFVIESLFESMILRLYAVAGNTAGQRRIVENRRKIDASRLPVINRRLRVEHVHATDHVVDLAEAQLRHVLPHLLGNKEEEIDYVLGLAGELLAQRRILRGNSHRTSIQVALAQHDAAHRDQRCGRKSKFFRAQQRGDHDVAASLQLAISLHANAAAQVVHQQNLLRLGKSKFPRNSGVLDGTERRSAGATAVAGDEHNVGMRFRDAGSYRSNTDLRNQLHGNPRLRIRILQVVDQLREIFDRIDVVVRRRRNQADAGNRMPQARDDIVHFVTGELAALARLRALRHLDLQFFRIDQIVRGHAKAGGSDLLDRAAAPVAVGIFLIALLRLRRLRRYSICRRSGSWQWPASRALLC